MHKRFLFGALATALLSSVATLGDARAQMPSPPPSPIETCVTIDMPGSYVVTADVQSSMTDCIDVTAANVSLNLGGHSITGDGAGTGIGVHILSGAENVHVTNGTVSSFGYGVVSDAPFAHLARLTVSANITAGILLRDANTSQIGGSYLVDNGSYGIMIEASNGVSVINTRTERSGLYGIWLNDASYNFLSHNQVGPAGSAGIYLGCAALRDEVRVGCAADTHNVIYGNSIDAGSGIGIVLSVQADTNSLLSNTNTNGTYGAFDVDATCGNNTWHDNTFTATNTTCIS